MKRGREPVGEGVLAGYLISGILIGSRETHTGSLGTIVWALCVVARLKGMEEKLPRIIASTRGFHEDVQ